jgi:hypothetical protein
MNTQDRNSYEKISQGHNNVYHDFHDGDHYINSPCIVARDKIVHIGTTYLFSSKPFKSRMKLSLARLLNVRFDSGTAHFKLQDFFSGIIFDQSLLARPLEEECTSFMLVDMDYFREQQKSENENHCKCEDSLLEFEF